MEAADFEFDLPRPLLPDSWIGVAGGGLSYPIEVKVDSVDGTPVLVGMKVDGGRKVTSSMLREVRLGDLLDQLVARLVRDWHEAVVAGFHEADGVLGRRPPLIETVPGLKTLDRLVGLTSRESRANQGSSERRGRGAKPPTRGDLERFADAYRSEQVLRRRGAVTRTAQRMVMDRSTAHRWINLCKQQGLLPIEEKR